MAGHLHSLFAEPRFALELMLVCGIYMIPLAKRPNHLRRNLLPVFLVLAALLVPFPGDSVQTFLIGSVLAFLLVWSVCDLNVADAIFCVNCAYATQHFAYSAFVVFSWISARHVVVMDHRYIGVAAVVYVAFYFLFARRLPDEGHYHVDLRYTIPSYSVLILFALILSSLSGNVYDRESGDHLYIICRMYDMLCCIFLLHIQMVQKQKLAVQKQLDLEQQIWYAQKEQYQDSQKNIEVINQKCHDLKHQIHALRRMRDETQRDATLNEIEDAVEIYDANIRTGNDALDTVLTEKTLYCEHNGITMTCMADGSGMNFINEIDIYTIFGNAIDNAIESVSKIADPERRFISVTAAPRSGLMMIRIENSYDGTIAFRDGLPVTTKEDTDYHGFGLRGIRIAVEKYGGAMSISTQHQLFILVLSIPMPEGTS